MRGGALARNASLKAELTGGLVAATLCAVVLPLPLPGEPAALAPVVYLVLQAAIWSTGGYVAGRVAGGGGLSGLMTVPIALILFSAASGAARWAGLPVLDGAIFSADYSIPLVAVEAGLVVMLVAAFVGGRLGGSRSVRNVAASPEQRAG